jgi:hypothetical protein
MSKPNASYTTRYMLVDGQVACSDLLVADQATIDNFGDVTMGRQFIHEKGAYDRSAA